MWREGQSEQHKGEGQLRGTRTDTQVHTRRLAGQEESQSREVEEVKT